MRCVTCKRELPETTRICPYCGGRFFTLGEPQGLTLPASLISPRARRMRLPLLRMSLEILLWIALWTLCFWLLRVPWDVRALFLVLLSLLLYGLLRWPELYEGKSSFRSGHGAEPETPRTHRLP